MIPSTERILSELNFRECRLTLGKCLLVRLQMREKRAIELHAGRLVITASRQHHLLHELYGHLCCRGFMYSQATLKAL